MSASYLPFGTYAQQNPDSETELLEFSQKLAEKMNEILDLVRCTPKVFEDVFMGGGLYVQLPLRGLSLAAEITMQLVDYNDHTH
jgi:hypothetical protein